MAVLFVVAHGIFIAGPASADPPACTSEAYFIYQPTSDVITTIVSTYGTGAIVKCCG